MRASQEGCQSDLAGHTRTEQGNSRLCPLGSRYKRTVPPPMLPSKTPPPVQPRAACFLGSILLVAIALAGWPPCLPAEQAPQEERVLVESRLLSTDADESGFDVTTVDRDALRNSPALRLDDTLRQQIPGFSLFRRTSSQVGNPTTQGVSLRNIGPNGAGRTLVLLDGIPQNDPFGGWVYWSRLPNSGLDHVDVLQGGGAGSFGNAALGGTIALYSQQLAGNSATVDATAGSRETYEFSAAGQQRANADGSLVIFGRVDHFATDGYPIVRPDQRGPVDTPADSTDTLFDAGLRYTIKDTSILTLKASGFTEDRGNGTPRTNNSSQAADFSGTFSGEVPGSGLGYQATVYGQLRDYQQTFSSVDPARRTETPSQDQYSVPAQSVGGSLTLGLPIGEAHRLLTGVDARWVNGETNERFRFLGGDYTQNRVAGGEQLFVGGFAEDAWKLSPLTHLTASGRIDYYDNLDGRRRETSLLNGSTTLDEHFADRDGWVADGRIGLSQEIPGAATRLRAALYTGFRVPTLNELYRPFRVRNDITEANAALTPEHLHGAELGAEVQPVKNVHVSLSGCYNELDDPVANVTVAQGPVNVAPFGVIPAGGTGRLRENLGRAEIYGLESAASWDPLSTVRLTVSYLYSHGTVKSAPSQPGLEGKRLAEAPENQVTAAVIWTPISTVRAEVQVRYTGDQFDDDLNTLRLDPYVTVDASIAWQFATQWRARVSVENLFDTEYQTSRSADGLVTIGAPRLIYGSLSWNY